MERSGTNMRITRSYKLRVYPNLSKSDTVRYCISRFISYVNAWLPKLFFNGNKSLSTTGLGQLANQAQHRARGIITAQTKAAAGNKTNVPEFKKHCCPGKLEQSKDSSYSYWIKVSNLWTKTKTIAISALSHKKLNRKLRDGWKLSKACEVYIDKQGRMFALVFVSKGVEKAKPNLNTLGCDVGYKHSVCRSDGHIGKRIDRVISRQKEKRAEQQRQKHKVAQPKTVIKQLLDREARLAVERCQRSEQSLVVESPKPLSQLGKFKLQGWASSYFAKRCLQLANEMQVWYWEVNPAYTSIECSQCGWRDKRSRNKQCFHCVACGYSDHADINAAKNIALKGTSSLSKVFFSGNQEALA